MEAVAVIHSLAPGQAAGLQTKRGRKDYMSKGGQDQDDEIYRSETSSRELTNSRLTAVEPPWDQTRLSTCGKPLCSLVCLRGLWQSDEYLSVGRELAFRAHSLL